jgi:hypothetical protein
MLRAAAGRVALAAVVYALLLAAFPLVSRPLAAGLAGAANILFHDPGFGAAARFEAADGPRGRELTSTTDHRATGVRARNRLDLRARVWVPAALAAAFMLAAPPPPRRRLRAAGVALACLAAWALGAAWLIAAYDPALDPARPGALSPAARVVFEWVYGMLVRANGAVALFPLLLWAITCDPLRRLPGFTRVHPAS